MLLATCAGPAYYRMCSTDVYCSKQTGSSSTKSSSPIISSFLSGQKKTVDAAKICGGAENVVKTEASKRCKWIARFYYFRHLYSAGSVVCIAHNNCIVAHRYGQLYLHCSLIYFWVRFQLFA